MDLGHVGRRGNEMQVTQLCKGYLSTELLKVFCHRYSTRLSFRRTPFR